MWKQIAAVSLANIKSLPARFWPSMVIVMIFSSMGSVMPPG